MSEALTVVPEYAAHVELGVIRADRPTQLVAMATDAANALASVIESRKLFSVIQGKRFVKCEGWTTLAAMLGCTPHEIGVTEVDGVFTAVVELRRLTDGQPVGRASAECGAPDELDRNGKPVWANRPRYARRSMALTRATAKACRLAFSWIMALSGFEVTPAEEIPQEDAPRKAPPAKVKGPSVAQVAERIKDVTPPTATELADVPVALRDNADAFAEPLKWKNKLLTDFPTPDLTKLREFCEAKDPAKYAAYLTSIEEILESRRGE